MAENDANNNFRIEKFLRPMPKDTQERAVERELDRIRPQFRFTDQEPASAAPASSPERHRLTALVDFRASR